MFTVFCAVDFSMKLTHLSPVHYWFIQSYTQVYMQKIGLNVASIKTVIKSHWGETEAETAI